MAKRGPKPHDILLPEWFDLGKYARAGKLTLAEWYDQLLLRYGPWYRDFTARPLGRREKMRLNLIRRDGIPNLDRVRTGDDPLRDGAAVIGISSPVGKRGAVSSLTVRDFYNIRAFFKSDHRDKCREMFDDCRAFFVDTPPGMEWLDDPVDTITIWGYKTATVHVDLEYPDSVLVDQFKALLSKVRERAEIEKPRSRKTPKSRETLRKQWADSRVLPYIDLEIWAKENGVEVSDAAMARAIGIGDTKDGGRGGEVISETVNPLARKLLSPSYLKKLKSRIESGE